MNSLDYIKNRISSGETGLTDVILRDMSEISFKDEYKRLFKYDFSDDGVYIKTNNTMIAEFQYDPNADFNYFSTEKTIHDGTFLFIMETIERLLNKVLMCGTYCTKVIRSVPSPEENHDFYITHHLKYTLGDIVLGIEIDGDYVPKDKLWMRERTTAMIPIKFEIVKNNYNKYN